MLSNKNSRYNTVKLKFNKSNIKLYNVYNQYLNNQRNYLVFPIFLLLLTMYPINSPTSLKNSS